MDRTIRRIARPVLPAELRIASVAPQLSVGTIRRNRSRVSRRQNACVRRSKNADENRLRLAVPCRQCGKTPFIAARCCQLVALARARCPTPLRHHRNRASRKHSPANNTPKESFLHGGSIQDSTVTLYSAAKITS